MATRQNTDYGFDIQKLYLEMMLLDAETFVRCQSVFDHESFDKRLQDAAKFINDYVTDHRVMPTFEIVNAATKADLKNPGTLNDNHYDWLLVEFETFARHKALEKAILKSADLLEKGEYGPCEDLVKKAVQIGLQKDLGIDYFEDPKKRLEEIKDQNNQTSTGWRDLDQKLYGGFSRGELEILAAPSGGGKSIFLANLGVNFVQMGLNVVYFTFELSERLVGMRVDAMVTGIPSKNIFKNLDDVHLKVKMAGKSSGTLQIKYMPAGKNVNDIRSYLKEYETKTGRKVDILLIDYMDLMMPAGHKVSAENLFIKDKYVAEELRNLATETNAITVSAAQINRSGVEEVEYDHSHISGGISKIQTADNVFGIYTSRAMREQGKYQLQFLKTRNSSGVGSKIDLEFNIDTLRITDCEEDGGYSGPVTGGATTSSSQLVANIKRGGVVEKDDDNEETPKVRATTESAQLRNFLNNLGDD